MSPKMSCYGWMPKCLAKETDNDDMKSDTHFVMV